MDYKITFLKNEISSEEWASFFKIIFDNVWGVEMMVVGDGSKTDFFIRSNKQLEVLNNRLAPFYLDDSISNSEETNLTTLATTKSLPLINSKNLFELMSDLKLDYRPLLRLSFRLNKWNIFKTLPAMKLLTRENNQVVQRNLFNFCHLYMFLSFNMMAAVNSEIARVKPVLAVPKSNYPVFDEGVIETKRATAGKKFSVQSYDFLRHTLIVGQSGSGKSILAKLLIEDLYKKFGNGEYAVVLIDPHGTLNGQIEGIPERKEIDFKKLRTNLFLNVGQSTLSTELTLDLFSTVMDIKSNQNLLRMLKYCLNLLFSINKMSVINLKQLLTDTIFRKEVLKECTDPNLLQFFNTEFQQLNTGQYATAVLPILNVLSELDFINNVPEEVSLPDMVNQNFLVSIPIKQSDLGTNITKIIGGAIMQQVFTMKMAGMVNKKIILAVDEFSVIQTPSLIHILSEARKFGLGVMFIQQYLMQVSAELQKSIFANVVNYFSFKLARDDAETVARNLGMEIDEYFLKNKNDPKEIAELGVKILTDLNPQEVVCRAMSNGEYNSPFKGKTVTIKC